MIVEISQIQRLRLHVLYLVVYNTDEELLGSQLFNCKNTEHGGSREEASKKEQANEVATRHQARTTDRQSVLYPHRVR